MIVSARPTLGAVGGAHRTVLQEERGQPTLVIRNVATRTDTHKDSLSSRTLVTRSIGLASKRLIASLPAHTDDAAIQARARR
eukprot:3607996-Prymnesium_polylepis.1